MHPKLPIVALSIVLLPLAIPVEAQLIGDEVEFYIRTDRGAYVPGDSGTLLVTIFNGRSQAITIKNITITYDWLAYLNDRWDGNETISNINQAIASGQVYNFQRTFTVPNDGRATIATSVVEVRAGTDIGGDGGRYVSGSGSIPISVPTYLPLGVSSSILPILTIALLAAAVIILLLVLVAVRGLPKIMTPKASTA